MADLNERLLAQKKNEDEAVAGELNASKRGDDLDEGESDDLSSNPEEQVGVINQNRKEKEKKRSKTGQKAKALTSGIALIFAGLLRQAWGNLLSSYGLTFIWIQIHFIGNLAFGDKIFCELGKEWTMRAAKSKTVQSGLKKESEGKDMVKKGTETIEKGFVITETTGFCCISLALFLIFLANLLIIAMVFDIYSGGILKHITKWLGWVWRDTFKTADDSDFD